MSFVSHSARRLPAAYLRVEPEDPHYGKLGVVVRDALGGVAWRLWPITAE